MTAVALFVVAVVVVVVVGLTWLGVDGVVQLRVVAGGQAAAVDDAAAVGAVALLGGHQRQPQPQDQVQLQVVYWKRGWCFLGQLQTLAMGVLHPVVLQLQLQGPLRLLVHGSLHSPSARADAADADAAVEDDAQKGGYFVDLVALEASPSRGQVYQTGPPW